MSSLGDAMNRRIKEMQGEKTPAEKLAADEARRKAAEEAKRLLDGTNPVEK